MFISAVEVHLITASLLDVSGLYQLSAVEYHKQLLQVYSCSYHIRNDFLPPQYPNLVYLAAFFSFLSLFLIIHLDVWQPGEP